ncbi:hypothetical protein BO71DRAFT_241509 [Aspergillus ellipticus CBS 707.79]|uniref:Uncharacterized protein n=1 Tax=Aspergillus ellipticus CBS 707.79 TaxID=1448320 RepID=A0A319D9T9_9EURO|nr:hypothetical protein BO71DRAFT_241509 [Aspergillus ellipticus CBS 707.79]
MRPSDDQRRKYARSTMPGGGFSPREGPANWRGFPKANTALPCVIGAVVCDFQFQWRAAAAVVKLLLRANCPCLVLATPVLRTPALFSSCPPFRSFVPSSAPNTWGESPQTRASLVSLLLRR